MPKVSAAHKEQVRQRLLDAARTVVLRDGHEGATTRAIVTEAGLSAGALYTYFSSKEELFEALVEDALVDFIGRTAADGPSDEPPVDTIRRFAEGVLLLPDLPSVAWFRGRMSADADVQDAARRFNRYVVETMAPLVRGALGRDDLDTDALVELFDVIVEGLNKREVMGTFATSFERVGSLAAELLLGAVIQEERV